MPGRPLPAELAELATQRVRRALEAVRDPRAKALRRRRRARRAVALRSLVTLVAGSVTAVIGSVPAIELTEIGAGTVTGVAALGAIAAGVRAVRLHRTPLPTAALPPAPPLPPAASAARAPLGRLAAAEASLGELLGQLGRPRHGVPPVTADDLELIRQAAIGAAATLRSRAAQLQAVERAVHFAPPAERGALSDAVGTLAERLDDGVDDFSRLVAAAGRVVAASGSARRDTPPALTEATDRLTGLAAALRELADAGERADPA